MKFKELKEKNEQELDDLLNKAYEDLQSLRFKVFARQFKDVREIRVLRKQIAQILTIKQQKKSQKN